MTAETITTPSPGVYQNVAAETYHSWPLPSNSLLNHLARSPLHAKHAMDFPASQTPDMAFGEAAHMALFEVSRFEESYCPAGHCVSMKQSGDRCENDGIALFDGVWRCGVHSKKQLPDDYQPRVISSSEQGDLAGIIGSIRGNKWARETLSLKSQMTEVSIVFDDPATGVRCKMRADRIVTDPRRRCIIDLKTCRDAGPEEFSRTIFGRGYFRQAAMYLRGCAAVGIEVDKFVFIAVEKEPPYAVAVYELDPDDVDRGSTELDRLLKLYAECDAANNWPGYGDAAELIQLPAWVRRRDRIETEI